MQSRKARSRVFRVEMLDERIAPSTLTVTPPTTATAPVTATIASQGATNGIDSNASSASSGVVTTS